MDLAIFKPKAMEQVKHDRRGGAGHGVARHIRPLYDRLRARGLSGKGVRGDEEQPIAAPSLNTSACTEVVLG
jgi:hypothetical protein